MSGTILLADDSLTIQKVVELTFADTEYRVVAVSSGDELLERMAGASPDLIICDVIMPGKDGYEVCQEIKSSPDWLHLPVILLTGTFEPFDRDRAIAAGCSEIITKPFEAQKLVDTVERLIGAETSAAPAGIDDAAAPENAMADWPEERTPVEVPPPDDVEFGTKLSETGGDDGDDDGIEFTTSGFAEMEAASLTSGVMATDAGSHDNGIEYEIGEPASAEPAEPATSAPPDDEDSARTMRIDTSQFAVSAPPAEAESETAVVADDAADEVAEPFADSGDEPFEEVAAAAEDEPAAPAIQDEPSMADTSPIEPPVDDDEAAPAATPGGPYELTDEDIDRIARRVIELASDRLEQIAWEIVPDMAEIVVRQRIRELEAESESAPPEPVQ
jgi:CheY-like chemotaxis protein